MSSQLCSVPSVCLEYLFHLSDLLYASATIDFYRFVFHFNLIIEDMIFSRYICIQHCMKETVSNLHSISVNDILYSRRGFCLLLDKLVIFVHLLLRTFVITMFVSSIDDSLTIFLQNFFYLKFRRC